MRAFFDTLLIVQWVVIVLMGGVIFGGYQAFAKHYEAEPLEGRSMDVADLMRAVEAVDEGVVSYEEIRDRMERMGPERRDDVMAALYLPHADGDERMRLAKQLMQSYLERPGFLPDSALIAAYRGTAPGDIDPEEMSLLLESIARQPEGRDEEWLYRTICGAMLGMPPVCKKHT